MCVSNSDRLCVKRGYFSLLDVVREVVTLPGCSAETLCDDLFVDVPGSSQKIMAGMSDHLQKSPLFPGNKT